MLFKSKHIINPHLSVALGVGVCEFGGGTEHVAADAADLELPREVHCVGTWNSHIQLIQSYLAMATCLSEETNCWSFFVKNIYLITHTNCFSF